MGGRPTSGSADRKRAVLASEMLPPVSFDPKPQRPTVPAANPPAFNVPRIVLFTILVLAALHLLRTSVLSTAGDFQALVDFSFISGCFGAGDDLCAVRPAYANVWSTVTHAFLHGDWMHLGFNALWLLAFGTPVARRLGALRFCLLFLGGAMAGAGLFHLLNPDLLQPMIGASGSVSAMMGAASRFALGQSGRFNSTWQAEQPRLSVGQALRDRTILFFVVIFFATNLVLGSGVGGLFGQSPIAWEAHLGGFAFGFLCFSLFDRRWRPIVSPR